ncbi:MAG TPA: tetratricopeptide repeat protein, partial [Nitrososphaera sp.]|nr:tetratricopeptide repeat protein [Nitrososphaera sp.]
VEQGENLDMAITMAQSARRRLPENPNVADTLGFAYVKKGVYSSAIELLQEATKNDPKSASAHYHLGLAYEKTKDLAKAREQFVQAAKLEPESSDGKAAKKEIQDLGGRT